MQGLITLDFGNPHPHAGLFQKNLGKWALIKVVPWAEISLYLEQLGMTPNNTSIVLSEVKPREEELFPLLQQGFLLTRVKDYWRGNRFAGMMVDYAPALGEDRLIYAHYCYKREKVPTLIIDAGTFVTMDVITAEGFKGGYIIPGSETYLATFQRGEKLKHIPLKMQAESALPHETEKAMAESYFAFSLLAQDLCKKFNIRKIILTGGQLTLWRDPLQHLEGVSIQQEQEGIHWALHHWMTTQIEPL